MSKKTERFDQDAADNNSVYTVLLRNSFYQDGYSKMLLILVLTILLDVVMLVFLLVRLSNPPEPRYFPATSDGRVIRSYGLDKPVVSDSFVLQWSTDAIRSAFALDFVHWRDTLSTAESNFTPYGWKGFVSSLRQSNNLNTLLGKKLVSNLKIIGSPEITRKAVVNNRYIWRVSIPALLHFQGGTFNLQMPMNVTLIVVRAPVHDFPQRIAINNFISQTVTNTGGSNSNAG